MSRVKRIFENVDTYLRRKNIVINVLTTLERPKKAWRSIICSVRDTRAVEMSILRQAGGAMIAVEKNKNKRYWKGEGKKNRIFLKKVELNYPASFSRETCVHRLQARVKGASQRQLGTVFFNILQGVCTPPATKNLTYTRILSIPQKLMKKITLVFIKNNYCFSLLIRRLPRRFPLVSLISPCLIN